MLEGIDLAHKLQSGRVEPVPPSAAARIDVMKSGQDLPFEFKSNEEVWHGLSMDHWSMKVLCSFSEIIGKWLEGLHQTTFHPSKCIPDSSGSILNNSGDQ